MDVDIYIQCIYTYLDMPVDRQSCWVHLIGTDVGLMKDPGSLCRGSTGVSYGTCAPLSVDAARNDAWKLFFSAETID